MRSDVKTLIKTFQVKTFGNVKNLEMLELEIRQDEKLLYISPTNIRMRDRTSHNIEFFPGVLFISDLRIVFRCGIGKVDVREFLLLDMYSVASKGNGISGGNVSFSTENMRIDFLTSYKKDIYMKVETVLSRTIENAVKNFNENNAVYDPKGEYTVTECHGCGAHNILRKNVIRACSYCERPLSSR